MAVIELKIYSVKARGKWYHYAWRGGPRIHGEPGTPEFMAAYNEAIANHRLPDRKAFRSVVIRYKESSQYQGLADLQCGWPLITILRTRGIWYCAHARQSRSVPNQSSKPEWKILPTAIERDCS